MVYREGEPVRAGFRVAEASDLAGGPIAIEFFIEPQRGSRFVQVSGDRNAVSIRATFAGVPLADPSPGYWYSGPVSVVEITPNRPLCCRIVLGEHVCTEAALDVLEPGGRGALVVTCASPLRLRTSEREAWYVGNDDEEVAEAELRFDLVRDDARLAALVTGLVHDVVHGPPAQRERPLTLLLTLRSPAAVALWRGLADHRDPIVADRAQRALENMSRPKRGW